MTPRKLSQNIKSTVRTSQSHPLLIDWISPEISGFKGFIGMTFAPGKQSSSVKGNFRWHRDIDEDMRVIGGHADILVCLIEDHEFDLLNICNLEGTCNRENVAFVNYPIKDVSVPVDPFSFCNLITQLLADLERGKNIVIHCRGGLGRTGLLAACLLVTRGFTASESIKLVRQSRQGTVETTSQEDFVFLFWEACRKVGKS